MNSVVNSYNEWDPLEEVIVGIVDNAHVPQWHPTLQATMPKKQWPFFKQNGGKSFPSEYIEAARKELEAFVHILESEGVKVRRPDPIDFGREYATPDWSSPGGMYAAMPRDLLLVVGDQIIEAPMAWRSRYFEVNAYRTIIDHYFRQGARWVSAPKPRLLDSLYQDVFDETGGAFGSVINEDEPTFDAADFVKCGKDIVGQQSQVTNKMGIEWLRRHLGSDYRIHLLDINDPGAMHIDASFMPLAPGKVLINRKRVKSIPEAFKYWEVFEAPEPCGPDIAPLYMTSKWINMNILMLDEERIIVERQEENMIKAMRDWGFRPIPCDFRYFNAFGGSFHCATVDIRRRGGLESYVAET